MSREKVVPNPKFPYRSTQEQRDYEESASRSRMTRRAFLAGSGAVAAAAAILTLTGKGDEVAALMSGDKKGPTKDQQEAYLQLVVQRVDVIGDLVLIGQAELPSKLRSKPYVPTDYDRPAGKLITKIGVMTRVGNGIVVLGNDPGDLINSGNRDPWLAILNPVRDMNKVPKPEDVVFSHYGNFQLTDEQRLQVMKDAHRLAA